MSLKGKAVLVTGASRGIGRAIAVAAAKAGADLALAARGREGLEETAREAEAAGVRALVLPGDAGDAGDIAATVAAAVEGLGGLDALVNNAGVIEPIARLAEADEAAWAHAFQINLIGPALFIRAALPHLKARKGAVLNVSSGAAHRPHEGWSAYCSTKAALWMQTQALHLEEGGAIDVYAASPGTVDTEMQVTIRASGVNPISQIPRGDLAPAWLPAAGMVWLLAERPEDLKGTDVNVRTTEFLARADIDV